MKTLKLTPDTIIMIVSIGCIVLLVGSLVYAIITGQVDTNRL